jgi:PAS domain S-box-containing protein
VEDYADDREGGVYTLGSMRLRTKTILILSFTLVALVGVAYMTFSRFVIGSFLSAERDQILTDTRRAAMAIIAEVDSFAEQTANWSAWDDTYNFMSSRSEDYIRNNLNSQAFRDLEVELVFFFRNDGLLVFSGAYDHAGSSREVPIPMDFAPYLSAESVLLKPGVDGQSRRGIVVLSRGPMLVVAHPILTSEGEAPARGTLVFGKFLDDLRLDQINRITGLTAYLRRYDDPLLPEEFRQAMKRVERSDEVAIDPSDENILKGSTIIRSISGDPALIVRVEQPRVLYQQGKKNFSTIMLLVASGGAVLCLVVLLLFEVVIISRLQRYYSDLQEIVRNHDLSLRTNVGGADEISMIGSMTNSILSSLESFNRTLQESEARFRDVVDNVPILIWMSGADRKFYFFNLRWLEFAGRFEGDEVETVWAEGVHPQDLPRFMEEYAAAFDDMRPFRIDIRLLRHDNLYRDMVVYAVPRFDSDGGFVGYLGTCVDITDVVEAKELAEGASRAKSEFIETMGVELRTLATSLLEVTDEVLTDNGNEVDRTNLQLLRKTCLDLMELVKDELNLSKFLDSGAPFPVDPATGRCLRILVAEDNLLHQRAISHILREQGWNVTLVKNGLEAVNAVEKSSFDMILMDCQMPVLSGFDAAALIRRREEGTGQRLPILALTVRSMEGGRERCLKLGMDDVVEKPVDGGSLVKLVSRYAMEEGKADRS